MKTSFSFFKENQKKYITKCGTKIPSPQLKFDPHYSACQANRQTRPISLFSDIATVNYHHSCEVVYYIGTWKVGYLDFVIFKLRWNVFCDHPFP